MGIKGLWTVLTPYSEKKSLHEIRGETVAVDLAGWICDSQNVTEYHIQPKLYLRNLFFRTIYLLLADVTPIFVLEGDAPELKRDVMAVRNAIQFRGAAPKTSNNSKKLPDMSRKRFRNVLNECESLLKCMGVCCVKGKGEAEATCAQLNSEGLVDAVVSQDSDCFAYGARRVYRNFSVSSSSGGGAMQGSVDCYDATIIYEKNGFGRNKMVALALMCGCDYGSGACGSSINTVIQFLHTVPENDIISRLLSWVTDTEEYNKKSRWISTPGMCDRCGHVGRTHLKNGCPVCVTHRGCNDLGHKSKVSEVKRELSLRSRALSCGAPFPEPKVMKEFMNTNREQIDINTLKTTVPSLVQFVKLMTNKLDWSERYCVEKFLPLVTKSHFQDRVPKTIQPVMIKKKRTPRSVPSYEVVWRDIDGLYGGIIPDDQFEDDEDPAVVWTTTERQDLMQKYYPNIVKAFEESIKKPVKERKPKGRSKAKTNNAEKPKRKYSKKDKEPVEAIHVTESLKNLKSTELNSSQANVSVCVNKLKRKLKNSKKATQKTVDSFLAKKKRQSLKKSMQSLSYSFRNLSIEENFYEEEGKENINYLSFFNKTEEDVDERDLSGVIESIVTRHYSTETAKVGDKILKLVFEKYTTPKKRILRKSILKDKHYSCSTPNDTPIKKKINEKRFNNSKVNTSYFFDKLVEEGDAFEMSLQCKDESAVEDLDMTMEYSLPKVCL